MSVALEWLLYAKGAAGFYVFQEAGPGSTVSVNFIVCCLAWAILGVLICVCRWPVLARDHLLFTIVLTVVAFHFLNVVREPHQVAFGDARVYYSAAVNMQRGEPIAQRAAGPYLYPPLLAAALTPLVRLGPDGFVKVFHLLNFPAVVLLAVLLYLALRRFRFSRELAALVVFVLLVVNVPVQPGT